MAKDDWAIVVGIKSYLDPALAGLQGPENDAREFYDWVVSPAGGAVPKPQAKLILSSDFPPFTTAPEAMPTAKAITAAFEHLRTVAAQNAEKGLGRTVGRRLYVFLSGHGFAPARSVELTALLTAEATIADAQLKHIIGSYMTDHFWRARFFEQILLFMDCCRSLMDCAQLYMPFEDEFATGFDKVRRLYAYGARVAKESREWQMSDGAYHGVFTRTLLDALRGSAADPRSPSEVTAESLRNQIYTGFTNFLSPQDRQRAEGPPEPEVTYEQKPNNNFTVVTLGNRLQRVFGLVKLTKYPVTVRVTPPRLGKRATLRDKNLAAISTLTLADPLVLSLNKGLYAFEIAGESEPVAFEVSGPGSEVRV
jgi:hypothetical protein